MPETKMITRELLKKLPKAELHVHLDGSLRAQTLIDLAKDQKVDLPATKVDELARYMHVTDARNLVDYLARFEVTLSVLQTPDALERATRKRENKGVEAAETALSMIELMSRL